MFKFILSIALVFIIALPAHAKEKGGAFNGGGGGTDLRFDFDSSARKALSELPRIFGLEKLPAKRLEDTLKASQIFVTDEILYSEEGGIRQEVAALNFPKKMQIVISKPGWSAIKSNVKKEALALHELLSLIGLEKTGVYTYSQAYYLSNAPRVSARFKDLMKPQVLNELEDPKITLVVFEDFNSPYEAVNDRTLKQIIENFGDSVQIVIRNFPITILHTHANELALAGICANMQGQFIPLRQKFLELTLSSDWSQSKFDEEHVLEIVRALPGIDMKKYQSCVRSPEAQLKLDSDMRAFEELKFNGTPSMTVSSRNESISVVGARPYAPWERQIKKMLERKDWVDTLPDEEPKP